MTHYYRVRKWLPARHGEPCRILARGTMNACLIEFADNTRVVCSRWSVRKLKS